MDALIEPGLLDGDEQVVGEQAEEDALARRHSRGVHGASLSRRPRPHAGGSRHDAVILEKGRHFTGPFFASAGPDTAVIASRMRPMFPQQDLSTRNWATPAIDGLRMRQERLRRMGRLGILLWSFGTTSHPINRGPEAGETSG